MFSRSCAAQVSGFVGAGFPEAVVNAIRRRFDASGHPARLQLVQGILVGNGKVRP